MFFDPMWARRGCVSQAAFFFDIAVVRCAVPGRTWRGVWKLLRLRETPIKAKSAIGLTPIARKLSQQPLRQHANCEADGDVARPMRQKNNSCQNQPGTETPDDISLFGRQSARGRSQRTDMHGMSRRKCIEPLPGKRDPSPMSTDRPAVRPLLVENNFEQMRQRGGHKRGQQNMIAGATIIRILATAPKPPNSRQGAEDMLIRAPCEGFRCPFR